MFLSIVPDAVLTNFVQTEAIAKLSAIMTSEPVDELTRRRRSAALWMYLWVSILGAVFSDDYNHIVLFFL